MQSGSGGFQRSGRPRKPPSYESETIELDMIRIESVGIEEKEIVYTLVGELLIMQRPFLAPPKSKGPLPQVLQAKVIRTMSQLSSRTALTLLADLIAFAQQLFPQSDSQKELRTNLEDVLYPFSSAALHLDTLE